MHITHIPRRQGQGHNQCFPTHRVLQMLNLCSTSLLKPIRIFWQWFYLSWENLPADSAAAKAAQDFSAQPPGTASAAQEPSRD